MKSIVSLVVCTIFCFQSFGKISVKANQAKTLKTPYYGEGGFDPDRLILGGNLGMNFYDKGYSAFISPTIGYSFGRAQLGISAGYFFTHQKIEYLNALNNLPEEYGYNSSDYNLSLFSRVALLGPLFLHAEPGYGFYKSLDSVSFESSTGKLIEHASRGAVPFVLVGGGFAFPIGDRVSFVIYALYDVIQNPLSPYRGLPVIRGGFNVGSFGN